MKNLRDYVKNMLENSFKFIFINYWRNVDKKILSCFFILFFLGLFFSFSSVAEDITDFEIEGISVGVIRRKI